MKQLQRELTLKHGVALAVGSIIGSGILFLPSLTAEISGVHTSWVWILTTILCVPLIFIFSDMVKHVTNGSGIEGFVSLGLGESIGATVPILFLGTISFGMPASALIVGEYIKTFFHAGDNASLLAAFSLVFFGAITNLNGIKTGSFVQLLMALITLLMGISVYFFVHPSIPWQEALSFANVMDVEIIIPGILIAFWAYAGFENMTFIASEFKNPKDFKLSMIVSLIVCGLLYWILSLSYCFIVTDSAEATFSGLLQITKATTDNFSLNLLITLFAYLAVQINFNSWIWGISRLIYATAKQDKLPAYFSVLSKKQIPCRAVLLLMIVFSSVLILSMYFVNFLDFIVPIISANFVFIYLLCLLSYVRFKKSGKLKNIAVLLFILLLPVMFSARWAVLYPMFLSSCGILYFKLNNRNKAVLSKVI